MLDDIRAEIWLELWGNLSAGRAPEIDALVGSVAELGRLTGTPTPHIDSVYALVKLLARSMDEQSGRIQLQALSIRIP